MDRVKSIEELSSISVADDKRLFDLIGWTREGIVYDDFMSIVRKSPFSLDEWSRLLHLSERTIQRYRIEKKTFSSLHSEKILELAILFGKGAEVFGDNETFHSWLESENVSMGGIKPGELLDSSFGVEFIKDELIRIEHGILA